MPDLLPVLASVPNISKSPLTIRTTVSGITILKQNAFRARYTGNKFSAVDINGNLWVKKSELMKHIKNPGLISSRKTKKRGAIALTPDLEKDHNAPQNSDNFSTETNALLTNINDLSTIQEPCYKINKKEVRQRILGYINTSKGKKELYFWTVSFPLGISDAAAYKCYNTWLTALRQWKMLKEYIWVAERQGNGTIHFHIAIPHKMPAHRANSLMKGTLKNAIRRGELNYSIHAIARYNGVHISKNKNTGHVVNFALKRGSRSLVGYLTKYVTKNDAGFPHLAWHNSRGFSSIFTGVTFSVPEFISYGFHLLIDRRKQFSTEFFTFVPWASDPPDLITEHLYKVNSHLQEILN